MRRGRRQRRKIHVSEYVVTANEKCACRKIFPENQIWALWLFASPSEMISVCLFNAIVVWNSVIIIFMRKQTTINEQPRRGRANNSRALQCCYFDVRMRGTLFTSHCFALFVILQKKINAKTAVKRNKELMLAVVIRTLVIW